MTDQHIHPALFQRPDSISDPLYVIATVFNPQRYKSRWKLYKEFEQYVLQTSQAVLYTIECSFGERAQVFTEQVSDRQVIIHVQTKHEIWIKENLINLAIQRLPADWKYVAWIDADVSFARPDWAAETIHQLQHYDVVQMFSHAHDLDADHCPYQVNQSFMYNYVHSQNQPDVTNSESYYYHSTSKRGVNQWHPGFAWAAKRTAIDQLGGLIDFAILGAADHHMAHALVGTVKRSLPSGLSEEYVQRILSWQKTATYLRKNVGYVKGLLLHYFHGAKKNRKYQDRWKILISNNYCPSKDIKPDWQGVYQLTDRNASLRDGCRNYFRQRNEDCIFQDEEKNIFS